MAARTKKAQQPQLAGAGTRLRKRQYGRNHAYYLDGDQKLDGVTTLIGDGMRKKALENWAGNETAAFAVNNWDDLGQMQVAQRLERIKKARFEVRDEAARRGTEIHRLAEKAIAGEDVDIPDELLGHVRSAIAFLDEWQIRPVLTETSVFSVRGGYAGTFDMVVTSDLMPGLVALADWKTSRSGIYGETALQLSAYENAEFYQGPDGIDHAMSELGINATWGIWIRSDGYSVYPMERGPEVFKTFQYVATVARRTGKGLDALKGEELFRPTGIAA